MGWGAGMRGLVAGLVRVLARGLGSAAQGSLLMHQDPLPLALARVLYDILHHITRQVCHRWGYTSPDGVRMDRMVRIPLNSYTGPTTMTWCGIWANQGRFSQIYT